jgi:hypothetical protein
MSKGGRIVGKDLAKSIANKDVQPAERRFNFAEHPADILGPRDVGLDDQTIGPSFPHLRKCIASSSLILAIVARTNDMLFE